MIIELKDIPNIPIKKLDVHIEFSDSHVVTSSFSLPSNGHGPNISEQTGVPEQLEHPENTDDREPRVLPEMENADF